MLCSFAFKTDNNGTPKLPNYTLVDASLNYRIPVGDNSLQARLSYAPHFFAWLRALLLVEIPMELSFVQVLHWATHLHNL
jgi:hypothetical protein